MGYRTSLDINAKCPLYESVVRTSNGNIAGVQCTFLCENFGFRASTIIRCKNYQEVMDLKELFCDEMFESCPYYQAWLRAQNLDGK